MPAKAYAKAHHFLIDHDTDVAIDPLALTTGTKLAPPPNSQGCAFSLPRLWSGMLLSLGPLIVSVLYIRMSPSSALRFMAPFRPFDPATPKLGR
jgi:hypothetical protein